MAEYRIKAIVVHQFTNKKELDAFISKEAYQVIEVHKLCNHYSILGQLRKRGGKLKAWFCS